MPLCIAAAASPWYINDLARQIKLNPSHTHRHARTHAHLFPAKNEPLLSWRDALLLLHTLLDALHPVIRLNIYFNLDTNNRTI